MGVCLAENSLMMVMENWGKSKQFWGGLSDGGFWMSWGLKRAGSSWFLRGALRSGADFRRSTTISAVP